MSRRDVGSRRQRKKVEMLLALLKRILRLDRLRPLGPNGAKDELLLAATAQRPTLQISAALMVGVRRWLRVPLSSGVIIAGGAARCLLPSSLLVGLG
jgi:hypothetical protein